ncbi:MAG: polysaccharide deacetylase family protein [Thermaerobacter sp.]|nr:hypothetical protein [Bacillota bacterium]REJ36878.1 MAG: hypothetical protein DIU84_05260 [Bacillota bacterium]
MPGRPSALGTRRLLGILAAAAVLVLAACGPVPGAGEPPGELAPPVASEPASPPEPPAPEEGSPEPSPPAPGPHPSNPLGRVPILLYHRIGETEGRWQRTPEGLYADLEQMYEAGFRPIRLRDYLDGRIDLPPGYAPVILTFDDSTAGHLAWDEPGKPAAGSAAGVIQRFAAEHPGWEATAVFFINAGAFGGDSEAKAAWLVENGFEVENHTWSHADLAALDAAAAAREAGRMSAWIEAATGRAPVALALPYGRRPRDAAAVLAGSCEDHQFRHQALLEVGWGPARSPLDPEWDPLRLPRIQVADPGEVDASDLPYIWASWLERLLESGDLFAH